MKLSSGSEGVTWGLEDDTSLPDGLSLNENTGIISGIPKKTGKFTFTVYAEKDGLISEAKTYTITIDFAGKIQILTQQEDFDKEKCIAHSPYYLELETIPESVSWDITSGDFPSGFDKTSLRNEGHMRGVPTNEDTYEFTLTASLEGYESSSRTFVLEVFPPDEPGGTGRSVGKSGGGGGCSSGFSVLSALILAAFMKRR